MSKQQLIEALAAGFSAAKAAALAVENTEDGGTSNFDSPAFSLPRVPQSTIEAAAAMAGVNVTDFRWFGRRWYWVSGFFKGQGNYRSRMSSAATQALKAAVAESIPGMSVLEYQQAD